VLSGKVHSSECCGAVLNGVASKSATTMGRHHNFAHHMQRLAKQDFSSNFKFTGLTKVTPDIVDACC
jgi:hypothetical protein